MSGRNSLNQLTGEAFRAIESSKVTNVFMVPSPEGGGGACMKDALQNITISSPP